MITKYLKTLIVLFLINTLQAQTTYYVDATGGNDSNNGTTIGTAWKTINKVNQMTFIAGDTISFKRGEIWNNPDEIRLYISDISGTASSPIVYNAYGTGDKPIISSVVPQTHTWLDMGGNIWKADNPPTDNPGRLLVNGVEKLRANIQSELDGISFFWRYDHSTNDLYLYSVLNPNTLTIEYSTDFPVIIGYSSFIIIENLDIQGGRTGIYINTLSKNIYLRNMNIGKYCSDGVVISSGSSLPSEYPENIIIDSCNFNSFFAFDYSSAGSYPGSSDRGCGDGIRTSALNHGEIKNCEFKNWGHASIGLVDESTYLLVHDNYLTSPDICYGGRIGISTATHCEVFNNQIINTSVSNQLNGQFNHYHHNIFSDINNTPLKPSTTANAIGIQAYTSTEVKNNTYENNVIIDVEGLGIKISGNNTQDIHNNIFRNNIIMESGTTIGGKSIEVEGNLYEQTYDNSFHNNLVYSSVTNQTCDFRDTLYDITGFNALSGSDGYAINNNIAANPMFADAANSDFHLLSNSPCINTGGALLSSYDYDGNTIPFSNTLPDIGIYEYQGLISATDYPNLNELLVFPNPTTHKIYISTDFQNYNYQLISLTGNIVLQGKLQTNEIDVSEIKSGIYILKLTDSKLSKESIMKIIKEGF